MRPEDGFVKTFIKLINMYSLKDHLLIIGKMREEDIPSTDMFCVETNAEITLLANEMKDSLNCFTFTIIRRGYCKMRYNGKIINLKPGDLYLYVPGQSVKIEEISDDFKGIILLVSEKAAFENLYARNMIKAEFYSIVRFQNPVLWLEPSLRKRLVIILKEIIGYLWSDNLLKHEACQSLFTLFLIDLIAYQKREWSVSTFSKKTEQTVLEFLKLVSSDYRLHHDIKYYASALSISPIYLSRIVKEVTGMTVMDHIDNMLLMDASWMLRVTGDSIKDISEKLHFSDQASFSKFFKRMKGISPKDFRH